jgi:hypothetical protein
LRTGFSIEQSQAAFQSGADQRGFVGFGEDLRDGVIDVAVGNAACAEFADNAETSLAADFYVLGGVVQGVLGVIEVIELAEAGDYGGHQVFIFGAAFEVLLHLVDGMRAAHEGALGGHVELGFGYKFAGGAALAHGMRIVEEVGEVKEVGEAEAKVNFTTDEH